MKNRNIFVACDTSNIKKIKKIIFETRSKKLNIIPKFGLQFFYSKQGRNFLEKIKYDFWLDLKINDIPQTSLSAIDSLKDLKKCKYITVHASGGLEMLKSIKKKAKKINKSIWHERSLIYLYGLSALIFAAKTFSHLSPLSNSFSFV